MTVLWAGLSVGAVYALVAIAYNIPLAQSGVFNFAQGQFTILGVFLAWYGIGDRGWPWWLVALGSAAICGAIAMVEEFVAVRPVLNGNPHAVLVTTVGASVVISGTLLATWGQQPHAFDFVGGENPFELLGGRLLPIDLWLPAAAVVAGVGLHLISRYTAWGLRGRAANDDKIGAQARGVNVPWLRASSFAAAGALAGLVGPLVGPKIGVDVSVGTTLTIFGFVALALGGFGSYLGALIGGLTIGLVQAFASRYFGSEYPAIILFAFLLVVLLLKPSGVFGRSAFRMV